jgi:hypothetical protein
MPFSHKQIAITFDLGEGKFGESSFNRVKLSGPLRASVEIVETGGPALSTCHMSISGMTLSNMNALSTLGIRATVVRRNMVTVEAGDVNSGLSVAYQGQIIDAWSDFSGMPEVTFYVNAGAGYLEAIKPIPPTSYNGLADVVTIMKGLATQAGLNFTNDGVTSKLIDPYLPGTIYEQMRRCADAAGIEWILSGQTVAIWPRGGARGQSIPIVSPDTGMIGYPTFTQSGIQVTLLYTPSINFGQRIEVKSSLTGANGTWQIQTISHSLESETPGGAWTTRITAVPPGLFAQGGVVSH